jgi:hypothetical protein
MATRVDSRPDRSSEHADLGTAISRYLRDAETGRVPAFDGGDYSPAALRSLRRTLDHVASAVGALGLADLHAMNAKELESLGWQVVDYAGLPPSRAPVVVDALRRLSTYSRTESPADPPPRTRRYTYTRTESTAEPRPRTRFEPASAPAPAGTLGRTPTHTMLALGTRLGAWIERVMVIALLLTAIGLALALI